MNLLKRAAFVLWIALLTIGVQAQQTLTPETDPLIYVNAVAWSHDGSKIAAVGIYPQDSYSGYIRVLDAKAGQIVYQHEPGLIGYTSVTWSPHDQWIAVGSFDGSVQIIDVETGQHVTTLWGHQATVTDVAWSMDGTRLVSGGSWDQFVFLWDATTYQSIHKLETTYFIDAVAFSPDDQKIAVGGDSGLYVFPSTLEVGDGRDQLTDQYISGFSGALTWNHNGHRIAFGTQTVRLSNGERPNAHLYILDADNRTLLHDIESPWGSIVGVAWSPDDSLLAVYHEDNVLTILDSENGSILGSFTGSARERYQLGRLAFSPYGGRLAYGTTIDPSQPQPDDVFARSGVAVVVPAPSLERLNAIAERCGIPSEIAPPQSISQLADYVALIAALPADTFPPACSADLVAVAEALNAQ